MTISERLDWALSQPIDPTAKLVLVILVQHYNSQTGQCNPSIERIVALTGYNRRTIFAVLDRLAPLVERELQVGRRSNYLLHFEASKTDATRDLGSPVIDDHPCSTITEGVIVDHGGGDLRSLVPPDPPIRMNREVEPGREPRAREAADDFLTDDPVLLAKAKERLANQGGPAQLTFRGDLPSLADDTLPLPLAREAWLMCREPEANFDILVPGTPWEWKGRDVAKPCFRSFVAVLADRGCYRRWLQLLAEARGADGSLAFDAPAALAHRAVKEVATQRQMVTIEANRAKRRAAQQAEAEERDHAH